MVFFARAVAIVGVILKLIAAEPAGWFLVPLAMAAGIYHVMVHTRAARAAEPPIGLAAVSDMLFLAAILLQIDFGWTYHCAEATYASIAWIFGWTSGKQCILMPRIEAFAFDVAYYIPVAASWRWLRQRAKGTATGRAAP
jgi:hypothetical protein